MDTVVVAFSAVSKTYAKELGTLAHAALADVSFLLNTGETLGLIGANGAGKSTCIKLLMDFIRPDVGSIAILGQTPAQPIIRRRIGYLPETATFPSNLTVLDMLRFTGSLGTLGTLLAIFLSPSPFFNLTSFVGLVTFRHDYI